METLEDFNNKPDALKYLHAFFTYVQALKILELAEEYRLPNRGRFGEPPKECV